MDKEQAMNLLQQVCAQYRGTLEEHNALQEALRVVSPEDKSEDDSEETESV